MTATLFNPNGANTLACLAILLLAILSRPLHADSIGVVTDRTDLPANETLDWSQFGPLDTDIPDPGLLTTSSGLIVTVSQPEYGLGLLESGLPANENGAWTGGGFVDGEFLLTNWNSPLSITISFSSPIFGAGVQVEPAQVAEYPAPFTGWVTAYDGDSVLGTFSVTGTRTLEENAPAPFLGVESDTADITSLVYHVTVQTNGPQTGDMVMDFLSLETTTPTPEPSNVVLIASGLLALIAGSGAIPQVATILRRGRN